MTFEPQNLETALSNLRGSLPMVVQEPLGRLAGLEVRIARTQSEIVAAQELRHRVFCLETGGNTEPGLDADDHDAWCDHLIVVDRANESVVGTYRLLREEKATAAGGFIRKANTT